LTVSYLKRLVAGFPQRWPELGSGHVGFVVNKAALGQAFSWYFISPAKHSTDCSSFIIVHHHPALVL
jgi:hypothetical protein